jgi:propanol-preferring alcohol dehydrogenase
MHRDESAGDDSQRADRELREIARENAMQAMVLKKLRTALEWTELPDRQPGPGELRVRIAACGVCRTDLHVVDGELPDPKVPIIPGHEIVGRIDAIGAGVEGLHMGERIGIPWLGHTCGVCPYCMMHRENLCDHPIFTGVHARRRLCDRDDRRCAFRVPAW